MQTLRRLSKQAEGFTLIELLVVIVIIGILLAIAVPSYLGFKDRANNRAAESDIRAAVPSAEAYYADNGPVHRHHLGEVKSIDSGLLVDSRDCASRPAGNCYCLGSNVGGKTCQSVKGPGASRWYKAATQPAPARPAPRSLR